MDAPHGHDEQVEGLRHEHVCMKCGKDCMVYLSRSRLLGLTPLSNCCRYRIDWRHYNDETGEVFEPIELAMRLVSNASP